MGGRMRTQMSDKYILRSGAIDAIKRNAGTLHTGEAEFLFQKVIFLLKNAPAADVAPVVHGQWGDNGIPGSMLSGCSICGFTCGASSFFYCPSCGARMDGGEDRAGC